MDGPLVSLQVFGEDGALVRQMAPTHGNEGELAKAKIGSRIKTALGYDAQYRVGTFADGKNPPSQYAYDRVGNLTGMTYPLGDRLQFPSYDRAGNLLQRKDGKGVVTTYTHASDDSRLTDIAYSDTTPGVHYDYDLYGRVTGIANTTATITYAYDDNDLLLSATTTYAGLLAKPISYGYFLDGSRASMNTPGGSFSYVYDNAGRMTSVSLPWTNGSCTYTYLTNGWLQKQTTAIVVTTYTYNARGFLTRLQNTDAASLATLSDFSNIRYNGMGQRTHMDISIPQVLASMLVVCPDASGTVDYTYDDNGRLIQETSSRNNNTTYNGTYTYTYSWDNADNALTFRSVGQTFNANNQLSAFSFDQNGNQTASGVAYDAENRLSANLLPGSVNWTAAYREDGLRAWKSFTRTLPGSGTGPYTYFLYDGDRVVCELDTNGTAPWRYGYGANGLVGGAYGTEGAPIYYTFDPQGTLVQRYIADDTHPGDTWVWDAFGGVRGNVIWDEDHAHERVICTDEITNLQPRPRLSPTLPALPDLPVRVEHEYQRCGALNLLTAFDTRSGQVWGVTAERKHQVEFLGLLALLDAEIPQSVTAIYLVLDNVPMHTGKKVKAWLAAHPRFVLVYPPVHCSWMNQGEQWFSILRRKRLKDEVASVYSGME